MRKLNESKLVASGYWLVEHYDRSGKPIAAFWFESDEMAMDASESGDPRRALEPVMEERGPLEIGYLEDYLEQRGPLPKGNEQ